MKNKTIMFLTDLLGEVGGAEQNLCMLARGLKERGYSIIISCLQGGGLTQKLRNEGFMINVFSVNRIYGPNGAKTIFCLNRIIRNNKVSAIICYHESSDFLGACLGVLAQVPVFSSRRDMGFQLNWKHIWVYRLINRCFTRILTVSEAVKQRVVQTQWIDADDITVIKNGVNSKTEVKDNSEVIAGVIGQKIPDSIIVIGCLANIRPIKGQAYLIEAAKLVAEEFPDFYLLFLGGYDEKSSYFIELKEKISDYGLEKNVFFTGRIEPSIVPQLLSCMDISVLSSLSEGMSNAILESMVAGLPVVATSVGGNPECVMNNHSGFLVPKKDSRSLAKALLRLISSEKLRKKMGAHGYGIIKSEFSDTFLIDQFEKMLNHFVIK